MTKRKSIVLGILAIFLIIPAMLLLTACGGGNGSEGGGGMPQTSYVSDFNFYYLPETDSYAIRKYIGNEKIVTLPDKYTDGRSITEIYISNSEDDQPFLNCSIEEVTIPASITKLHNDENVFYGASNLKKINVDKDNPSFTSYDDCLYNKDLTTLIAVPYKKNNELKLPDTLTKITTNALAMLYVRNATEMQYLLDVDDCYEKRLGAQITSVTLPSGITELGWNTFNGCANLKTVDMSKTQVKTLDYYDFAYTPSLENVLFPSTLRYIKYRAFAFSGIKELTIPKDVTSISFWDYEDVRVGIEPSDEVFIGCRYLEKITAPASVLFGVKKYQGADYVETHPWNYGLECNRATFFGCINLKEIVVNNFVENESYMLPNFTLSVLADHFEGKRTPESYTLEEKASMTFRSLERIIFDCDMSNWLSNTDKAGKWELHYNRHETNTDFESGTMNAKNLFTAYPNLKIYTNSVEGMQKALTYYVLGIDEEALGNRIMAAVRPLSELGE